MTTLRNLVSAAAVCMLLSSCMRVIDLKLGDKAGKMVIEGNVTNVSGAQIIQLTRNVAVTAENTYPAVKGATVTVTDDLGATSDFTEISEGVYSNSALTGIPGRTYTMTVVAGDTTFTATSKLPAVVPFDSISYKDDELNSSKHKKLLTVSYQDPPGEANQYRFVVWLNGSQVKTVYAFDDEFNDGRSVSMDLRVQEDDNDDYGVYSGDAVKIEMQCIDRPLYTYWYTLQQQSQNGPGGGVTPADPPTNITPVSLGYFSAHSSQTKTIVIN